MPHPFLKEKTIKRMKVCKTPEELDSVMRAICRDYLKTYPKGSSAFPAWLTSIFDKSNTQQDEASNILAALKDPKQNFSGKKTPTDHKQAVDTTATKVAVSADALVTKTDHKQVEKPPSVDDLAKNMLRRLNNIMLLVGKGPLFDALSSARTYYMQNLKTAPDQVELVVMSKAKSKSKEPTQVDPLLRQALLKYEPESVEYLHTLHIL